MVLGDLLTGVIPARTLPAPFYASDAVFAADLDIIFCREWLYAGHVSAIPEPGDYFVFELANESVIVVRQADGSVLALANVCRHRGSRVCLNDAGSARTFVCKYHGWTYGLDGSLRSRRHMPSDFEPSEYGLKNVHLHNVDGLLFVNLGAAPPEFLGTELATSLAPLDVSNTKVASRREYPIAGNWKLAIENYHECYHCSTAHPEYSKIHSLRAPEHEAAGLRYELEATETGVSLETVELSSVDGQEIYYGRHPLYPGYVTGTEDGTAVAPLLGHLTGYDGGASDYTFGQTSFMLAYSDHLVVYSFKPTGPKDCLLEVTWLVHTEAQEGVDYNLGRLCWLWDVTSAADKTIIENNQRGIDSRFYEPGPLSDMEAYVAKFLAWYVSRLRAGLAVGA
jgi:phenylpropionate dioxygenase-like ring-hydroxylating dioxygenase large terminal subunit